MIWSVWDQSARMSAVELTASPPSASSRLTVGQTEGLPLETTRDGPYNSGRLVLIVGQVVLWSTEYHKAC